MPTNLNGTTYDIPCGAGCPSLTFSIPDLRSTDTYVVSSVPYSPYAWTVPTGGTEDPLIYADDKYSANYPLPFPFCFYGDTFNSLVVGSNGLITFEADFHAVANCNNAYRVPLPIPQIYPFNCNSISGPYYPRGSIMGVYSDLDPTLSASPADRKIQWRVEGTAPCRRFVVSYYNIGVYGNLCGMSNPTTFQIVLYESTGIIDVIIKNKTCLNGPPGTTFAILGLQNWEQNQAVAAPGKNCTEWSAQNETFRFTPAGPVSKFLSAELLDINGNFLMNATIPPGTPPTGMLNIRFSNLCSNTPVTQYIVRTTYTACPSNTTMVGMDTITVQRRVVATTDVTQAVCGSNQGTINVNLDPTSAPGTYTYTLNPGNISNTTGVFSNLAPGTYTITIVGPGNCPGTVTATVSETNPVPATATPTAPNCAGVNDGSITVSPSVAGTYTYVLNPGNISQSSPVFNNLAPGNYNVTFTSTAGCNGSVSGIILPDPVPLAATAVSTPTSCPQVSNGTITVTPSSGGGPFTYTLNPGNISQSGNVFTGLAAGNYTVTFSSPSGCQGAVSGNIVVDPGPPLTAATSQVDLRCSYTNDGTLTVTPNSGMSPYSFTLNPGNVTQAGALNTTFTGLSANTMYTVAFSDAAGCQGTATATLTSNPELKVAQNNKAMPLCNGESTGSIDVSASGGVANYEYSSDGGTNFQGTGLFTNLPAGTYNIRIRDNVGCIKDTVIDLAEPTKLLASAANTKPATCGGNDGEITIMGQGGTPPYFYSVNGGAFVGNNIYVAPIVGPYPDIKVRDANGCVAQTSTNVVYINNLVANIGADTSICEGDTLKLFPQVTGNANIYRWVPGLRVLDVNVKDAIVFPIDTTVYKLIIQQGPCSAEDEIQVNVKWKPRALAGGDTTICFNDQAVMDGGVVHNSGNVLYNWVPIRNLGNADTSYTIFTPTIDTTGTFIYTLHVKDDYGCGFEVTDQKKITVKPAVPAFAGKDTIGVKGLPHKLLGSGGVYYEWSPPAPLSNPFVAQPYATIYDDTRFYMKTTDEIGCVGYDTVLVKIYEGPTYYIPNAFSPNGDGLNDVFRAVPVGIATTEYFRVYDRWGELVFSTKEFLKGWDGTYRGKKVPLGVYVWMVKGIDREGKTVEMKGTVTVIQ